MSTKIRPELSEKNKYWIDRHRYYELKHFCLQYPTWKKAYAAIDGMTSRPDNLGIFCKTYKIPDITCECAAMKYYYSKLIKMIEDCATETHEYMAVYILKAVTEGRGYEYLRVNMGIPCCKDTYYELYRRFFWLLNKSRN